VEPQYVALIDKVYGLLNASITNPRPDVSNRLCRKLNNIFLATNPNAYGVWKACSLWFPPSQPAEPQTLADLENKMLVATFAPKPISAGLEYVSSDDPADGMVLLAILAHELGHLLLADTNADGTGGDSAPPKKAIVRDQH